MWAFSRSAAFRTAVSLRRQFHVSASHEKAVVVQWGYGERDYNIFESNSVQSQGDRKTLIAAGASHRLIALKGEDESGLISAGMNFSGQLGIGRRDDLQTFGAVDTLGMNVLQIACGREHSMLLAQVDDQSPATATATSTTLASSTNPSQGTKEQKKLKTALFAFGNSMYGQLGLGASKDTLSKMKGDEEQVAGFVYEPSPTLVQLEDPDENVLQVVCGLDHTVLRTDRGNLYSMGWGADGQLGLGPNSSSDRAYPTLIERLSWSKHGEELGSPITTISSSTDFTLALLENNDLWIWGNAEYGQCMVNKKIDRILEPMHVPHPIPPSEKITNVAAGGTFALLLTDAGEVYTCGYGALGLGADTTHILMPQKIPGLSNIKKIVASTDYAAAITDSGKMYTWGSCGMTGRLGHGEFGNLFEPKRVVLPEEKDGKHVVFADVALGMDGGLAVVDIE
ncbi:Williams-Beuren syndrome chromosome region 16 protein [Actinomortierella wolfii]|nr:Williams-Beuren syndrome chromosome region 16 protein [Actinomortierella wolfii]